MSTSDRLTPIELEYLTVVSAAEEAPLHELAWDLAPRLSLAGEAFVAVASRVLADLIRRNVVGLERRGSLDQPGVELPTDVACEVTAVVSNWAFPRPSPSAPWHVLFLTESGEAYYNNGFRELSQARARELLFGSRRGATRVPG